MQVQATTSAPSETGADTIVLGLFEGEELARDTAGGALKALVESGEAKPGAGKVALTHADGLRWLVVGLGPRGDFDAEGARTVAAKALDRAQESGATALCWEAPAGTDDAIAAGIVEGTLLAAYRFRRYRSEDDDSSVESLTVSSERDAADAVRIGDVVARAQNAARDLQNTPANDMTPTKLADRARELADTHLPLWVEVEGREQIEGRGMGAFAAVARGSDEEPALITIRYEPVGADGPRLGFVGKAVTFDTGGISIKPSAKMEEMKFDMSGGAAVIEAMGAIAELELGVAVVAVIGATENMPSGRAMRPGDIVTASNGTTIEINNTDAEGRLVLADCLAHAVESGAERLVDLATLTGAIVVALGSTHAGLFSNDDEWAAALETAGVAAGEPVWRLPLHAEYAEMIKGRYADITNVTEARKASSITAAEFLKRFVGDTPWAHVDIAGTAWDTGRAYAAKGGSGFGVHLLVALARRVAGAV